MNFKFIFQFSLYLYMIFYGISCSSLFELFSENEKLGNTIASYDIKSAHTCLILCNTTFGCFSVNFHKGNEKCLLTDHYPATGSISGTSEVGWKIYYRRTASVNLLDGAVAFGGSSADKAIDGVTASYLVITFSCFYQGLFNSYWAIECGKAGFVKEVDLYLYSLGFYYRNTNFKVSVASTQDDILNDVGKFCGAYNGPVIDKPPFKLTIGCENVIYGKFLKVSHTGSDMQLCEVVVYTPFN